MKVRIPGAAELRAWGANVDRFPSDPPPSNAGEAVVVGTLDWSETLPGWIGKWRMRWQGADYAWGISGINYNAAFRNIVRGVVRDRLVRDALPRCGSGFCLALPLQPCLNLGIGEQGQQLPDLRRVGLYTGDRRPVHSLGRRPRQQTRKHDDRGEAAS